MPKQYPFALKTPFHPGALPLGTISTPALWFIFSREKVLMQLVDRESMEISTRSPEDLGLSAIFTRHLGRYGTTDCFVAETDEGDTPLGMQFHSLRGLFGVIDQDLFSLTGRALQIIHWHREHRFCGRCGTLMVDRSLELARECPNCSLISHPRLSPAVIMAVVREDKILLARAPRFPEGMYSTLAGFVEPGETLEEAVAREVLEETGIEVDDIRYVASQPWPFPHSLMIGFSATYAGGEIRIDDKEIEAAGWFAANELPPLPSKVSIARLLIDNFIESRKSKGVNMSSDPSALCKALEAPQDPCTVIGTELVRQAVEASRRSPRRRIILPLHKSSGANLHRMLNAVQPYSYVRPHRHLHPAKPESILVLQGAILTIVFGETGQVQDAMVLAAGTAAFGIDIEPGVLHSFLALQRDTVLFEVKPGPYEAQTDKDFGPWAPAEDSPEAAAYMADLYQFAEKLGWPIPDRGLTPKTSRFDR